MYFNLKVFENWLSGLIDWSLWDMYHQHFHFSFLMHSTLFTLHNTITTTNYKLGFRHPIPQSTIVWIGFGIGLTFNGAVFSVDCRVLNWMWLLCWDNKQKYIMSQSNIQYPTYPILLYMNLTRSVQSSLNFKPPHFFLIPYSFSIISHSHFH